MTSRQSTLAVLEDLRDHIASLDAQADNLRPELRPQFRAGFAQCRRMVVRLITDKLVP